ncbi:MAG: Na/Pi cotransporter family protein [Candidatus Cloacimonetes bacterium]|nr:Na/Pi cotransporter family protein [Candidatus Cloacimonadota bacterium]
MTALDIINFFGGLALFIFGMNKMSDNLQAIAGSEMKRYLKRLTNTPLKGVMVGIAVTGLIQSSSATSVMLIGLVNAGIMNLTQAIGVIMGANIGTTVTAQLIAFKIGHYAFGFVVVGVVMLLIRRSKVMEKWSLVILGFGLLFVGLNVMSAAVKPLQSSEIAKDLLTRLSINPILGVFAGTAFTMLIQSSSASIGIVIVLATNGLIPFEGAIYLVFGDNIGTTVTAWLASINTNSSARRVATVHTMFNVIGASIFSVLTYLGFYPALVDALTPGPAEGEKLARHIANTHTLFNVLNTLIFLPFTELLARIATRLIPTSKADAIPAGEPKHLDYHLLQSTDIAIEQSIKEMREMLILVKTSLELSMQAFIEKNYRKQTMIHRIENSIDHLQREITLYLIAVNEYNNNESITKKIPALLHTVNDLEKLGDYSETINKILNDQILSQKCCMNDDFSRYIDEMHKNILYMLDLSIRYMENFDLTYSYKIIELEGRINQHHQEVRNQVIAKIQSAECDATSGLNTIDYIDTIEVIADKMKNLVKAGSYKFIYSPSADNDPRFAGIDIDDN